MPDARTFVYVSNAEDGDIGIYRMHEDGTLQAAGRAAAARAVMPMAVNAQRRLLYAAARSTPWSVHAFAIDAASGALRPLGAAPLAESMAYISLDRSGRFLLAASYGAGLLSVNAIGPDGCVEPAPLQVLPAGAKTHSIRVDASNRFAWAPALGSDRIFQFTFDADSGRLAANAPDAVAVPPGTGPRHFVVSPDNRFLYVLSELLGTVAVFSLDGASGLLSARASVPAVPPGAALRPGVPRNPAAAPGAYGPVQPRDTSADIWAADIHMTPDGRYLYVSERTGSTLGGFRVDRDTGGLAWLDSTPTEQQPRGFAIDPDGRYLVAAGERSETLSVYAVAPASGRLRRIQQVPGGRGANWVEIVRLD